MSTPLTDASTIPVTDSVPVVTYSPVVLEVPGRPVDLEMKVSAPATGGDLPILLFSHGHGVANFLSSLRGYGPLVDFWAAHGFAVIQPTHLDSNALALRESAHPEAPLFWRTRAKDMSHILDEFTTSVRDLVARGRAAGVIVVAATQRPSADIIPTSLRDLFGYRWAFRCTTPASSDVVLGHGWAGQGYSATDIDPGTRGVGWLLAEGGIPRRMRAAFLDDGQVRELATVAAHRRAAALDAA